MTCRTCKHLKVEPDAAGRIIPRKGKAYECNVEIPCPTVPESVTKSLQWKWPPAKKWMEPRDGENCPTYAKR